jgi:hypothetical protein
MARLRGVDGVVPAVLADGERGGPGGGAGRSIDMYVMEFIRERNRMCKHFGCCAECPANDVICGTIGETNDAERLVQIVEEWAKEHPHKTRQDKFLEQYPEARVDKDGILRICPADITKILRNEYGGCKNPMENCHECYRRFWQQEVE